MTLVVVDVEADGTVPHLYSMVSFGAVVVEEALDKTFYGKTKPISETWIPEALAVSGISREEHLSYDEPKIVMENFREWLSENTKGKAIFISDNLAFDWQWINYYFHRFVGKNPFGFSGRRIGDLYAGMMNDMMLGSQWKKFRKTTHSHHPLDDAKGNAEALLELRKMGLKIPLK
ncbi:MAG: hypothetical protein OHK0038_04200 [Flammeovirgaceae bacterium]